MNQREENARNVARKRAERCRHFNGVQHEKCEAGVCYQELSKTGMLPCLPWHNDPGKPVATCDKRATYTPEELAEQERDLNEHLARMEKVMASIAHLRRQVRQTKIAYAGMIDCAACGGKATLAVNICSSNGHARGRCACGINWIE